MIKALTHSLAGRLLLASMLVLPLFLGGTGYYLERSYRLSLDSAAEERLQLQVIALLAEADYQQQLQMPEVLLEPRFNLPNSGLYASIRDLQGDILWQSPSAITFDLDATVLGSAQLARGEREFVRIQDWYRYRWAVLWQTTAGKEVPLEFAVLETTRPATAQLGSFRRSLWLWLGGATLALLACQVLVLLWGLRPLRELAQDITRIETGAKESLGGPYPLEVQTLTDNLTRLINVERKRRERTRNTLSDLAHSLKTPLAVMRNTDADSPEFRQQVVQQSQRMEEIISYQLQRASGGSHNLLRLIPVAPEAKRLATTLEKVYVDKGVKITLNIEQNCQFRGDERDLLELLGNLMDNACKYGRTQVQVAATGLGRTLRIIVADDGEGIAPEVRESVQQRGTRADSARPGQGIGLAVASDIAQSYGGRLSIGNSALGGAEVSATFAP